MTYIGKYYYDGKSIIELLGLKVHSERNIYEVVRVINHKVLFWPDHFQRLLLSLKLSGFKSDVSPADELKNIIEELTKQNEMPNVNVRLDVFPNESNQVYVGTISSFYPPPDAYIHGVHAVSLKATRNTPNIKTVDTNLKQTVSQILNNKRIYEVILVDFDNFIREGSRSNLFFVCNNKVITAPDSEVLQGITRQKVIDICNVHKIDLVFEKLSYDDLGTCDAIFLSGTSPKILPISSIDKWVYQTKHAVLQIIIDSYNNLISNVL